MFPLSPERESYYIKLLSRDPKAFLVTLGKNIMLGADNVEEAKCLLEVAKQCQCLKLVSKHRDVRGDTFLHMIAQFHHTAALLKVFLNLCPELLAVPREGEFRGQTVLHIAISKGNRSAVRAILTHRNVAAGSQLLQLFETRAVGSRFSDTVMMGELPLTVAALTLNERIVRLLLRHGANICAKNSHGDTVFHSLIKFASVHPEKVEGIMEMMMVLHGHLPKRPHDTLRTVKEFNVNMRDPLAIWYLENGERLTPLKLAASLGQVEIFSMILNLESVYCQLDEHDGVYDIHLYDITEIDTVTQATYDMERQRAISLARSTNRSSPDTEPVSPSSEDISKTSMSDVDNCCMPCRSWLCRKRSKAVMEIICNIEVKKAFHLISVNVVRDTIKKKWLSYRLLYYTWMLLHLLAMSILTAYAVYKTRMVNAQIYQSDSGLNSTTGDSQDHVWVTASQEIFVDAILYLGPIYGLMYIALELYRSLFLQQGWYIRLIHHNGLYRVALLLFSLSLFCDSVWYKVEADNNYFLVLALLLGWWFMTFFLRAHKKFSFFTVMFQKVLLGDMFRFSTIICLQLISFSIAMYITFLITQPQKEEFRHLGLTILTMFKLMLGLTDIEILYDARDPWLAVTLFILFVLVTYVLLINSLIAMMSQTCAMVSEDRYTQWELQRLSVILLLESMIPPRFRTIPAQKKFILRYDLIADQKIQEPRFVNSIKSVQTEYSDGRAILKRKSFMRTQKFGNISVLLASHIHSGQTTSHFKDTTKPHKTQEDDESSTDDSADVIDNGQSQQKTGTATPVKNSELSHNKTSNKASSKIDHESPRNGICSEETNDEHLVNKNVSSKDRLSSKLSRKRHSSERKRQRTPPEMGRQLSRSFPTDALKTPLSEANSSNHQSELGNPILHVIALPQSVHGSIQAPPILLPSQSNVQVVYGHMTPNSALPQTSVANAQLTPVYTVNQHHLPQAGNQNVDGSRVSLLGNVIPITPSNQMPVSMTMPQQAPHGLVRVVSDGRLEHFAQDSSALPPTNITDNNDRTERSPRPRVQFLDINDLNSEA